MALVLVALCKLRNHTVIRLCSIQPRALLKRSGTSLSYFILQPQSEIEHTLNRPSTEDSGEKRSCAGSAARISRNCSYWARPGPKPLTQGPHGGPLDQISQGSCQNQGHEQRYREGKPHRDAELVQA